MLFPTRENRAWNMVATRVIKAGISLGQVNITVLKGFCPGCGHWGSFHVNQRYDKKNNRIVVYADSGGVCARCKCYVDIIAENISVRNVHKALKALAA